MLLEIKSISNQSMYDLCLMTYGSLDFLVKLCDDNGIDNVNAVLGTGITLVYESELIVNQQNSGIVMATASDVSQDGDTLFGFDYGFDFGLE